MKSNFKLSMTPIASAVALLMVSATMSAHAQEVKKDEPQQVVVTGIRASLAASLAVKRMAGTNMEVITSEDVGKMPDKNVADSLQRLPGVNIGSSAAGSGGFDENDRVSLRGTSPSLTNTLINGHSISSGDWFILDQVGGAVGRSVSFSLLPSEIVGQVQVKKTPTADMVEGGVSGTVDILTRHPLDAKKQFTADASIQSVYATLPKKYDPQLSASLNWKNEANTFGMSIQAFSEKRHLRRDGQEMLGYMQIPKDSAAVLGAAAVAAINAADGGWANGRSGNPYDVPTINTAPHPDLAGVYVPRLIGSSLFEQVRKREGGVLDVQFKPSKDFQVEATYFSSKMEAGNYNRNYMSDLGAGGAGGVLGSSWNTVAGRNGNAPDPGYTIKNGTLTSATWTFPGATRIGIVDDISRPGSSSSSDFLDLAAKLRVTDSLVLSAKAGVTNGKGDTTAEGVYEGDIRTGATGGSISYKLNGTNSPADVIMKGISTGGTNVFTGTALNWIFGSAPAYTRDKEKYAQLDAVFALNQGMVTDLKFGFRTTKHDRYNNVVSQRPYRGTGPINPATNKPYWDTVATPTGDASINPAWNGQTYPSDFGSDLGGGNFPKNVWQLDPAVIDAWAQKYAWRDPAFRTNHSLMFKLQEKTNAAYINADLEGGEFWSGNIGLRLVETKDHIQNYSIHPATKPGTFTAYTIAEAAALGYISTAGGSNFFFPSAYAHAESNDNNSFAALPSMNLRFDVSKDVVARLSASRTMTRPDFGALAGTANLDDNTLLGSAGNWNLKPIVSNNLDATVQWYYAPRALLSVGAFIMDMKNYVGYTNDKRNLYNAQISERLGSPVFSDYNVTAPKNVNAFVKGLEFAAQVPLGAGFGVETNVTLADGSQKSGTCAEWQSVTTSNPCDIIGTSKTTFNFGTYFENDKFNARVGWAWRSSYLIAYDRSAPLYQDAVGSLSVSLNYNVTDNITLTFSGQNMNNPILKNYIFNPDQPRSFYANGAQYYAGLRLKY
ncbi:MAG: TonB-dependent receptor [Undibacterium sp.]|nr:TonB-dependent receptor [Undibacterium sp.]